MQTILHVPLAGRNTSGTHHQNFLVQYDDFYVIDNHRAAVSVLGLLYNWLCFTLDSHFFHFFGAAESPTLFIINGIVVAAISGLAIGWLLFIPTGQRFRCITNLHQEQADSD